jgi:putative membrane protein
MNDDLGSPRRPIDTATSLAAARTVMAADRSLMAWIRTALSMISFGFTIYKVLQGLEHAGVKRAHFDSPRWMGLFLTALGTFSIAMGTVEYVYTVRAMQPVGHYRVFRPAMLMAMIMSLTGLALFLSISGRLV